jgi:hypothetical protein
MIDLICHETISPVSRKRKHSEIDDRIPSADFGYIQSEYKRLDYQRLLLLTSETSIDQHKKKIITHASTEVWQEPGADGVVRFNEQLIFNVSLFDDSYSKLKRRETERINYSDRTKGGDELFYAWCPEIRTIKSVYHCFHFINDVRNWYETHYTRIAPEFLEDYKKFCNGLIDAAMDQEKLLLSEDKSIVLKEYDNFRTRNELREATYPKDPRINEHFSRITNLYHIDKPSIKQELILHRSATLKWLMLQCVQHKCFRSVYYLAVSFFDRYITSVSLSTHYNFKLLGITCLFMATKVVGGYTGSLNLLTCANICRFHVYQDVSMRDLQKKIRRLEVSIACAFKFEMTPTTSIEWLDFLSGGCKKEEIDIAVSVLDVCSLNYEIMCFRPDLLAQSALAYVLKNHDSADEECLKLIHSLDIDVTSAPTVSREKNIGHTSAIWQIKQKNGKKENGSVPAKYAFHYYANDENHLIFSNNSYRFVLNKSQ